MSTVESRKALLINRQIRNGFSLRSRRGLGLRWATNVCSSKARASYDIWYWSTATGGVWVCRSWPDSSASEGRGIAMAATTQDPQAGLSIDSLHYLIRHRTKEAS